MIYDCFNFFDEFELLEIRLNELNSVVDKFVLVESTVTFTNRTKQLFYLKNKNRFRKFHKKITHIIVDDSPNVTNPWIIENHQLSAVTRGLKKCSSLDTILVSCVDEIPKVKQILEYQHKPGNHKAFMQIMTRYFLNLAIDNINPWKGTRMFSYKNLLTYANPYVARFSPIDLIIPDGGWHFTYLGGVNKIQQKLESFSHQEYNNEKYNTPEKILISINQGKDLFDSSLKLKVMEERFLPDYVVKNHDKFIPMILNSSKKSTLYFHPFDSWLKIKDRFRVLYRMTRKYLSKQD